LAIQGPRAEAILALVLGIDLAAIRYYWFTRIAAPTGEMLVSRTGYTGEDGFEIYLPWQAAEALWNALLEAGKDDGLLPAGLGARDTLRLEARMALYGHELDAETTPLEAGLGWVIKWDKGDFIGRAALLEQKASGLPRKLVCLEMTERGVPRQGYPLLHEGQTVGVVSSGTHSPTLNRPIAMGFLPPSLCQPGTELHIAIRGKAHGMRVVQGPFYKRKT
jgi:aminomethyltransferase